MYLEENIVNKSALTPVNPIPKDKRNRKFLLLMGYTLNRFVKKAKLEKNVKNNATKMITRIVVIFFMYSYIAVRSPIFGNFNKFLRYR